MELGMEYWKDRVLRQRTSVDRMMIPWVLRRSRVASRRRGSRRLSRGWEGRSRVMSRREWMVMMIGRRTVSETRVKALARW